MANEENLVPQSERSQEERKKVARMGGKASGEARRKKRALREFAEAIGGISIDIKLPNGKTKKSTMKEALVLAQYKNAINKGSVKSAYFIAQVLGELEQNINVSSDQPIILVNSQEEKEKIDRMEDLDI